MKVLLLLFFIGCSVTSWAQGIVDGRLEMIEIIASKVNIEDGDSRPANSGNAFVAIQGNPSSVGIRFTPGVNTGWEYRWGVGSGWNLDGDYNVDSTNFTFHLSENGLYQVEAFKEGVTSISQTFRVFFVNVDETNMQTSLLEEEKCDFFKLKLNGYTPIKYEGSYGGSKNAEYAVNDGIWLVDVHDETIARSTEENKSGDYSIQVKDGFGFVWTSQSVSYESVLPEAKPIITLLNTVDVEGVAGDEMGQAPLEVEFTADYDECNAYAFEWFLYQDTSAMINVGTDVLDSLMNGEVRAGDYFTYIYENTGRYMVKLVAINDGVNQCTDTSEIKYVNVVESLVDVPNVFTPNGDGKNDVFMVLALSVESFQGTILNRWGRKVYEWSDPTGGWDGRIHGRLANPGTYYYIITARGREKTNTPKYVKKGALMLIR